MVIHNEKLPASLYPFFFVVIFYGALDGVRDTFLSAYFPLSFIRDVSVLSFFFLSFILFSGRKHKPAVVAFFYFMFFFLAVTLINTVYLDDPSLYKRVDSSFGEDLGFWSKTLFFVILSFSLYLVFSSRAIAISSFFSLYLWFSLAYCLLTLVIIFFLPGYYESLPDRNWWGRLSIGYPTLDVFVLGCALVIAYFSAFNALKKVFLVSIFSVVLFMQNNVTGFIIYLVFLSVVFFYSRFRYKALAVGLFLCFIGLGFYIYSNSEGYGNLGALLKTRVDYFLFNQGENSSVSLRVEQMQFVWSSLLSNPYYFIFGYGAAGGFAVENTFASVFAYSGLLGFLSYLSLLIFCFLRFLSLGDNLCIWLLMMLVVSSLSVVTIYLFPNIIVFSMLVALACSKKNSKYYV